MSALLIHVFIYALLIPASLSAGISCPTWLAMQALNFYPGAHKTIQKYVSTGAPGAVPGSHLLFPDSLVSTLMKAAPVSTPVSDHSFLAIGDVERGADALTLRDEIREKIVRMPSDNPEAATIVNIGHWLASRMNRATPFAQEEQFEFLMFWMNKTLVDWDNGELPVGGLWHVHEHPYALANVSFTLGGTRYVSGTKQPKRQAANRVAGYPQSVAPLRSIFLFHTDDRSNTLNSPSLASGTDHSVPLLFEKRHPDSEGKERGLGLFVFTNSKQDSRASRSPPAGETASPDSLCPERVGRP